MPYRIDLRCAGDDVLDRLVELGALDAELVSDGGLAALMPDSVAPDAIARVLGLGAVAVSAATPRDDGSVWVLRPRAVSVGRLRILPAAGDEEAAGADAIHLIDTAAFGTGMHPTTALCLAVIEDALQSGAVEAMLDVGTGSGVLALAALRLGVPRALGIDVDEEALRAAAANARLNGLEARLQLAPGGPETLRGTWPLVVANVLAAPLVEMAPALVQRVGHDGCLVLSGVPVSLQGDVDRVYRRLGMHHVRTASRAGWAAFVLRASW